jgi:23S rRNA (cytosine1962-C5)-methyltransferase
MRGIGVNGRVGADIGAYRIYDRDVPEFPLAIDAYHALDPAIGLRVHVQEVDTGWQQEEAEHAAWLAAVQATVSQGAGVA